MQSMTIDSAAIRLTDTILGYDEPDLEQALKAIAANIGVLHISYVPLSSEKSEDAKLLSAICTYPVVAKHDKITANGCFDRLCRWQRFQPKARTGRTVEKGGGVSDLGGARQDVPRHCRDSESVVRQRQNVSGYSAS